MTSEQHIQRKYDKYLLNNDNLKEMLANSLQLLQKLYDMQAKAIFESVSEEDEQTMQDIAKLLAATNHLTHEI